jgi:hypothetical protein
MMGSSVRPRNIWEAVADTLAMVLGVSAGLVLLLSKKAYDLVVK